MKVKEYIKKYKLSEENSFLDHEGFVTDLKADFQAMIEFHQKATWNHSKFMLCVKDIGSKFDSLANRTKHRHISKKLWGYFYATVIMKIKVEIFGKEPTTKEETERFKQRAQSVR